LWRARFIFALGRRRIALLPYDWKGQHIVSDRSMIVRLAICALAALPLLVSGCGGDESAPPSAPQPSAPRSSAPQPTVAAAPAPPAKPRNLPVWELDKAFEHELTSYEDFEGYQIRTPNEFLEALTIPADLVPYGKMIGWQGPARDDGTRPVMVFIVAALPPDIKDFAMDAEQELNVRMSDFKEKIAPGDWQQTPTEWGQIGGVPFLRAAWEGKFNDAPVKAHGFFYLYKEGGNCIILMSFDAEPYHKETLKLMNASITTLRKKK
jgi:hypothetical protein